MIIGLLMQNIVSDMKEVVATHEIVRRVTQSYGSKFIEFKNVIFNMLSSSAQECKSLQTAVNIHSHDLNNVLKQKFMKQVQIESLICPDDDIVCVHRKGAGDRPRLATLTLLQAQKN